MLPIDRHADQVLSETEQHIKQIKDLPPEVKEVVQKEGFQDPHAASSNQPAEQKGGGQKEGPHDPSAARQEAQRAEE